MKPTYYITVTNTSTGVSSFVKDFKPGLLTTRPDNYRLKVLQRHEAESRLAKLRKYYENAPHLKFQLHPVKYEPQPLHNSLVFDPPIPKRKQSRVSRHKKDKPKALHGNKRQAVNEQIRERKEQRRKDELKAEAQRQASIEPKTVNLSAPSLTSSKVDCRHCGICRECLERKSLL
jgi:hypothetical protein